MSNWLKNNWFKLLIIIIASFYVSILAFEQYRIWRNSEWKVAEAILQKIKSIPNREDQTKFWNEFIKYEDRNLAEKIWIIRKTSFNPF